MEGGLDLLVREPLEHHDLLPSIGPRRRSSITRLPMTERGDWSRLLSQDGHHQLGCNQIAAVLLLVVSSGGQIGVNARTLCRRHGAAIPMNSRFTGQVGQESNLQPAVLEKAAPHSSPSDPVSPVR